MNTVKVENCKTLFIGRRGENEVTEVVFDFSEWQAEFGNGVIDLFVKRNGDSAAYPVVLSVDGTVATWLVTATDTNVADYGKAEYVYTVNGKIAKSAVFTFYVAEDIGQASGEAPDPYESWIETLTELGTETQANAQAAAQSASDAADSAASASESAGQAEDSAEDAEAWAVGERNGEPVTEGDPTYNNNAKFWAGKAMTDAPVTSVNGKAGDIVLNLDDIPNGVQYARTTPAQVQQIGTNAADIADIEELIPTEASANNKLVDKNYVDSGDQTNTDAIAAINAKIPPQASASNQLADKILVNTKLMAYRKATDQDAIDSAQDGKINALTNLLNSKQSKITANGILKGNGNGGVSAAVAGMDYLPTSALAAYRSANAQDAIDNAQNENINKNTAALTTMQPAATAADIGKALIVKTVADGKPTSYEYGEAGGGSALTAGDGIDISNDVISNTQGIEYIVGTQTAATSKWTGVSTDETLKVGKIIAYYLPYAGTSTAATLALTMADGTTTREISLQLKPNATVTTQFPAGSIIILVYDGSYWRVNASYDTDTNTYPTGYCVTNGSVAAKAAACSFGYRGDTNYFPCLFRYANTATDATLAITTYAPEAAPIYVNGARTSATNTFGPGVILFLYYNGAYYCYNDGRFPILVDGTVTSVQEYAAGLLADYRTSAAQDVIDAGKQAKITATGILKGDGAGGVSSATAGTDYATPQQVNEKYAKPSGGIPSTDMTAAVQASLSKADTALQAVPDTYRTAADQDVIDNEQDDRLDAVEQATTATTIGPVAIATFDASAADMPLKGLTVDIEPVQSGSGDPSPDNVRPITGLTGCKLHHTGVSLIGGDAFIGYTFSKTATGYQLSYNGSSMANRASANADIRGLPAGRYTIVMLNPSYPEGAEVNIRRSTAGSTVTMGTIISSAAYGRRTYNIPENTTSLQLYIIPDTMPLNTSITMSDIVLVREADDDFPEPYNGNVYSITFPSEAGTVYGGTLDVVNRKLNSYPYYSSYNGETIIGPWISSMDVYTPGATPTLGAQVVDMGGAATSYDLPDVPEITTLLGENNIWANRGDVTVTYGAYLETVKAYADKVGDSILSAIAPLETSYTASRSYAAGSFLFVGTKFYKVTAAISSGDTITPDTNVTLTTVAEQLMALANV